MNMKATLILCLSRSIDRFLREFLKRYKYNPSTSNFQRVFSFPYWSFVIKGDDCLHCTCNYFRFQFHSDNRTHSCCRACWVKPIRALLLVSLLQNHIIIYLHCKPCNLMVNWRLLHGLGVAMFKKPDGWANQKRGWVDGLPVQPWSNWNWTVMS